MRVTPNYGFNAPEQTDVPDITKLSANWDSIDTKLKTTNDGVTTKLDKSGGTATGAIIAGGSQDLATKQVRNMTISTAAASGGTNGDLWFKYT